MSKEQIYWYKELSNHSLKYLGILILSGLVGLLYNTYIILNWYDPNLTQDWSLIMGQGYMLTAIFIGIPICYYKLKSQIGKKK